MVSEVSAIVELGFLEARKPTATGGAPGVYGGNNTRFLIKPYLQAQQAGEVTPLFLFVCFLMPSAPYISLHPSKKSNRLSVQTRSYD